MGNSWARQPQAPDGWQMPSGGGDPVLDRALGCMLGVAVGDAAGAPLEFLRSTSNTNIDAAMRLPGTTRSGQLTLVTDDTELSILLARGLLNHSPRGSFPLESVAQLYSSWTADGGFCVGRTCWEAFSITPGPDLAARMQAQAQQQSAGSKANGALMRATPIAIWAHKLPPAAVAEHACADASLSHPNKTCGDANACYCIAAAHVIQHPGDAEGALAAAEAWAADNADHEVQYWLLHESKELPADLQQHCCSAQLGFVRFAFVLAFHHLRRRSGFEASLRHTLSLGGDTDTNAAIVGGLMGALHGVNSIPEWMLGPLMSFKAPRAGEFGSGHPRPPELLPSTIPGLVRGLMACDAQEGILCC